MANDVNTLAAALYATADDTLKEHPDLAGWAEYGYRASRSRFFRGLRLHLVCTLSTGSTVSDSTAVSVT
ncbi:hypothetical protein [Streptomyces sp. NPDC093094]|uniref:hypothetical protein n=1 Tax=Streptomyces sp. NPDC093094 TaxID=3366026 RepID=UPI003810D0D1